MISQFASFWISQQTKEWRQTKVHQWKTDSFQSPLTHFIFYALFLKSLWNKNVRKEEQAIFFSFVTWHLLPHAKLFNYKRTHSALTRFFHFFSLSMSSCFLSSFFVCVFVMCVNEECCLLNLYTCRVIFVSLLDLGCKFWRAFCRR